MMTLRSRVQVFQDGYRMAEAAFERTLAVMREEMAELRQAKADADRRADAAADLLLQHLGARAISVAGAQAEAAREERATRAHTALLATPDPTEDLPLDDPRGEYYGREAEASLLGPAVGGEQ